MVKYLDLWERLLNNLYHYCSTEAFVSIISHRSIRLSSLLLSNDSSEGTVARATLLRMFQNEMLAPDEYEALARDLDPPGPFAGLGFCLSEKGDLLSQWRGYADDGRGVSIGFNRPYLEGLQIDYGLVAPLILRRVIYDEAEQELAIRPEFSYLRLWIELGALRVTSSSQEAKDLQMFTREILRSTLSLLNHHLFTFKSPAFEEEHEWRLTAYLYGQIPEGDQYGFRSVGSKIVPFRTIELKNKKHQQPVTEVILGPKHTTPISVVERLLEKNGFDSVRVRRSSATYR